MSDKDQSLIELIYKECKDYVKYVESLYHYAVAISQIAKADLHTIGLMTCLLELVSTNRNLLLEVINKNEDNNKIDIVESKKLYEKYDYWFEKIENLQNEIEDTAIRYSKLIKRTNKNDGSVVLIGQDQNKPSLQDLFNQSYNKEKELTNE